MQIVKEWMELDGGGIDLLDTRMFYELMQQYRHAERVHSITAHNAFEEVKAFVREHCSSHNTREGQ